MQAQKLTPAQQKAKAERERCFAAGYDLAIRASSPAMFRAVLDFTSLPYMEGRKQAFEQWDLAERLKAAEIAHVG